MSDLHAARDPEGTKRIVRWLNDLALLVSRRDRDATREQIALYAEMLCRDFGKDAFNTDTLHLVASGLEWWPSLTALVARIEEAWKVVRLRWERRGVPLMLPPGASSIELSPHDKTELEYFQRRESAGWIEASDTAHTMPDIAARRSRGLAFLKSRSLPAWRVITGSREECNDQDWKDCKALTATCRNASQSPYAAAFSRMIRDAVSRHAPENMDIVDKIVGSITHKRATEDNPAW